MSEYIPLLFFYGFCSLLIVAFGCFCAVYVTKITIHGAEKIAKDLTDKNAEKIAEIASQKVFEKFSK